jgi:hypothetical protein
VEVLSHLRGLNPVTEAIPPTALAGVAVSSRLGPEVTLKATTADSNRDVRIASIFFRHGVSRRYRCRPTLRANDPIGGIQWAKRFLANALTASGCPLATAVALT